jgi:hypothetical protein
VNRKEVEAQKAEWDFYFSNANDVLSSLMVNLSAIRRAPDPAKSWLLWVWVHMLDARYDGLSSETEAPMLFKIEDRLNDPATRDHINAVVAELVKLAEQFGGGYDGWGCEVQKTPAA